MEMVRSHPSEATGDVLVDPTLTMFGEAHPISLINCECAHEQYSTLVF